MAGKLTAFQQIKIHNIFGTLRSVQNGMTHLQRWQLQVILAYICGFIDAAAVARSYYSL